MNTPENGVGEGKKQDYSVGSVDSVANPGWGEGPRIIISIRENAD